MKELVVALPQRSTQRAVVLSVLCQTLPRNDLKDIQIGRKGYATARINYNILHSGRNIVPLERRYQRYNPQVVRDAVKYILGDRNIQVLSWGTRKVNINGEEVIVPKLARKKCISNMIKEYHIEYDDRSERIGDTAFRTIA